MSSLKLQSAPSADVIKGGQGVKEKSFSINSSSLGPWSVLWEDPPVFDLKRLPERLANVPRDSVPDGLIRHSFMLRFNL